MEEWRRRSVLATGVALSIGTGFASVGAGDSETDVDELPDPDRDPGPDEDWPSHRGGPGHARYVPDGHEFEGAALEAAWSVDGAGANTVAVADETVYAPTDGAVLALDATDGTVRWENAEIDASTPSVAGESVYLSGEEIVALDRSDGSVRWETSFDPEEEIHWQTVAYGGVYAVVDGTLYALDADDGSVRWERESITAALFDGDEEEEYEFVTAPAAANGVIYSVTGGGPIALDPETGAEVWQEGVHVGSHVSTTYASPTAVAYDGGAYEEWPLHDARTGEFATIGAGTREIAFGEEIYVGGGTDHGYSGGSIEGDEYEWNLDMTYTYGQAVISGETAYAYFYLDGHNYGDREYDEELVALNKYDGSERWTIGVEDAPVGPVRAISGETIYVEHDGDLVALREGTDEDGDEPEDEADDQPADEGEEGDDQADDSESEETDQPDDGGDDQPADDGDEPEDEGEGGDQPAQGDADDGDEPDEDDEGDYTGEGEDDRDEPDDEDGPDTDDDGGNDDESDDGGGDENGGDDQDVGGDDEGGDEVADDPSDDETDGMPGFTTGAGLLGGALGLEWVRRRAGSDERTDPDERVSPDERTD
ncbi:outer membrane protein assembly factor BamB family protein [Natronococcus occultus]|uniref:PQQ repeat protein n=1 Tax=Natronococcus occultus SP4 TaxID=694430 RepID=L0K2L7_9EURY|nr:PQQ-binding-like beta-propeller repeat protein [Natronococcus occultus]AGB39552.1 PQQ repeat protein [Natronococcus occultus SP4]